MKDLNTAIIIGRLVRDAEHKYTEGGKELVSFSVACNDGTKEKEHASYFDCTLFGNFAAAMKEYLVKGKQVSIQGRLRQNRWEKDGQKRAKIGIIVDHLQLLSDPRNSQGGTQSASPQQTGPTSSPQQAGPRQPREPVSTAEGRPETEDQIPF
jgi:single-strand DNA-binding protein